MFHSDQMTKFIERTMSCRPLWFFYSSYFYQTATNMINRSALFQRNSEQNSYFENTNLKAGQFEARITSLAFPCLKFFSVWRYPKWYFPLFITNLSLALMFSIAFFCINDMLLKQFCKLFKIPVLNIALNNNVYVALA